MTKHNDEIYQKSYYTTDEYVFKQIFLHLMIYSFAKFCCDANNQQRSKYLKHNTCIFNLHVDASQSDQHHERLEMSQSHNKMDCIW